MDSEKTALVKRKLKELKELLVKDFKERKEEDVSPIWKVFQEVEAELNKPEGNAKSGTVYTGRP